MTALLVAWTLATTALPDSVLSAKPATRSDQTHNAAQCARATPDTFRLVTSMASRDHLCYAVRNGLIRLVVRREPVGAAQVGFPQPDEPRTKRSKILVLEANLTDLRRDSDGDSLSDLEERRLFLDWDDRETDDDGIDDDQDTMPNMPRGRHPTLLAEYLGRMLPVVLGHPSTATSGAEVVFLVANRAAITGLRSDRRMVVIEPDACREAVKRFGISCGLNIEVKHRDDETYWITWWGGHYAQHDFRARRFDDGWQLDDMGALMY